MQITIPERSATVKEKTQLLVVGAGPAGIGAAVAAARKGLQVILLEKRGFLGGNITAGAIGLCNHFMKRTGFEEKHSGISKELETEYRKQYGRSHFVSQPESYHTEYLKIFLDDFILKEKIKIYFHAFVTDVITEKNRIAYVIVQTKKGAVAFSADMIIDATGDGDVAYFSGIPYKMGRKADGLCQPGTLMFSIGGVDVDTFRNNPDSVGAVSKQMKRMRDEGLLKLSHGRIPSVCSLTEGGIVQHVNFNETYGVDATDFAQVSEAEIKARKQIVELMNFLRENIVGMQNIELAFITPEITFRESRRIEGEYELSYQDIENDRKFEDGIALFPRFYDLHSVNNNWQGGNVVEEGVDYLILYDENQREATIPYRSLVPVKMDNLLVAGRCICADPVALSCIRQVQACIQMGQAAGTAMSMAIKESISPREIDTRVLRASLKEQGVIF